jgi:ribonuclease HII
VIQIPDLSIETSLGLNGLVGVDEVGRGCIAGPVAVAACIVDYGRFQNLPSAQKRLIRDSKTLSASQRQKALALLRDEALLLDHSIISRSEIDIDQEGILGATHKAMLLAIAELKTAVRHVLVDGNACIQACPYPQSCVIKGDQKVVAIAAASILAKTFRDQWMIEQDARYPGYGFSSHVGYGTKAHMDAIRSLGVCKLHRRSFEPIKSLCQNI